MAGVMPSLLSLEAELNCSICLSVFKDPVTLPCGHNFCQGCLDERWKETFLLFCPQCMHHYSSKPELKKNTVLSAVVESFKKRSSPSGSDHVSVKAKESEVIKCDMCMVAKALKTCLTCMASFCEEHVKPHLENPIFRPHQLTDPLADLGGQICQDHNKIMEFFCKKHDCSICAICMQQSHRGCEFTTPQEIRAHKKSEMTSMLRLLDRKIDKNSLVMAQVREQQSQLQDDADGHKKMLSIEYQFIRDLIDKEEQDALRAIDKDLESGQTRIQSFIEMFGQNVEKMSAVKMELHSLLSRADSLSFLQASSPLASSIMYDPYCSHVNMKSKTLLAHHSSAVAVKELLTKILTLPVEKRFSLLKPGQTMEAQQTPMPPTSHATQRRARSRHRKGTEDTTVGPMEAADPTVLTPVKQATQSRARSRCRKGNEETTGEGGALNQLQPGLNLSQTNLTSEECSPKKGGAHNVTIPYDISSAEKRSDLLKFGTVLKLDPRTAHKRIVLTEDFTKASLAEEPYQYPDGPERFAICSQVLCSQSFGQGRHYWEVKISKNKSCGLGLGLACDSMDRKGPSSRLGLNSTSWCVEWFNDKLSAWHDGVETVLGVPGPGRVGILLDCDDGFVTFYAVADRAYPFHTFVFSPRESVYPAFWIFSANSSISLCKLT